MERQICKICCKTFSNGKALGGHMRSHYATLPLPPKTPQRQELSGPPLGGDAESTSSLEDVVDEKPRVADQEMLDIQDDNKVTVTETESPRLKKRGSTESLPELGMASSGVSEEEEGAWCLVMLSKNSVAKKTRYQCETCDKVFKSPQGLGSHRTSHKLDGLKSWSSSH